MKHHDTFSIIAAKIIGLNLVNFTLLHINEILSFVFTAISLAYLLWKWHREYKLSRHAKDKLPGNTLHGNGTERLN